MGGALADNAFSSNDNNATEGSPFDSVNAAAAICDSTGHEEGGVKAG